MEPLIVTNALYKPTAAQNAPLAEPLVTLYAAQNESPSFLVLIDTQNRAARLINAASPALAITAVDRYRIAVECGFDAVIRPLSYVCDNDGVKYADLIDDPVDRDYAGDERPAAIVDLAFRTTPAAGDTPVTVKLYRSRGLRDETLIAERRFTLRVCAARLPDPADYRIHTDLWQHSSNVARTFGVPLWGERHFAVLTEIFKKLQTVGQKSATLIVSDCPWRGWGCYLMRDKPANLFEYNIVRITKRAEGGFDYDFTALDRYLSIAAVYGADRDVTLYGLIGIWKMPYFDAASVDYPEAVTLRYRDLSDGAFRFCTARAEILAYVSALFSHLKSLGIWDRVRIGADEPSDTETFFKSLDALRSVAPDLKLKLAIDKPEIVEALGDAASDLAYSFPCTLQNYASSARGKRRLYYVCNVPDRPNSLLKNPLTDTLSLAVLNRKFGFDGFLRWAVTCWTADPRRDVRYNVNGIPAGDLYLLYPSASGGINDSLRFRALQKSVLLFELLTLVAQTDPARADALTGLILRAGKGSFFVSDELSVSETAVDYDRLYCGLLEFLQTKEDFR